MKTLVVIALIAFGNAAVAGSSNEVTDLRAIKTFLADPQTHAYNMQDPKGWVSHRKLILIGTKLPNGSCRYPAAVSTTGSYASFATEIAVNQARCQSLVLEGNPGTSKKIGAPGDSASNSHANALAKPPINNAESTDPKAIQAFLADPQTHVYEMHDPKGWVSYRKLILNGTKMPNGSCRYPAAVSTTGAYTSFATEIAVNHAHCQSLILEGNPGSPPKKVQLAMANNAKSPANIPAKAAAPGSHP